MSTRTGSRPVKTAHEKTVRGRIGGPPTGVLALLAAMLLLVPAAEARTSVRWLAGWGAAMQTGSANSSAETTYRVIARVSISPLRPRRARGRGGSGV